MNLNHVVEKLFEDSKQTPLRGLSAISEAEKYLQQAYEGRYFFELIQNVRDANKELNQDGEIYIQLDNNLLSISNTGAEFSPKGIEGITTIGQSTKQSQDYIGFKGIGFKSIQEITEEPKIITKYGTVYFDRKITLVKYDDKSLKVENIPLFYFPHYDSTKLTDDEIEKGIVTKIELPLKPNITKQKLLESFLEIKAEQLILLGNIRNLQFITSENRINYSINKNVPKKIIEVREGENSWKKYKYFTPINNVVIPDDVINILEGKEKEIFNKGSKIDINIVLEVGPYGQLLPIENSKLYLFYPLKISSGFRFIIHSYFIVNPERTSLRESLLNKFLLTEIGVFIAKEMLRYLKASRLNTNKILCFERNKDANIDALYDSVIKELKNQNFI